MEQRIAGPPASTLHGIEFKALLADEVHMCKLAPEALAFLRDRFAPGVTDSPLGLFKRLFDEVMTVVVWKQGQGLFEPDGSLHMRLEDAKQAFKAA